MNRLPIFLFLLLSSVLRAYEWAPIPQETWAVREDPKAGIQGAIILDEWTRYGVRDTEFGIRILVLSEAGKSAAQLEPFPSNLYKLDGRTVYPDGRVVEFSKAKDFSEQVIESNRFSSKQKVVVPPGLTTHCIVDLHWTVDGTYLWQTRFVRTVLRDYPSRHLVLKLTKRSPMGSVLLFPSSIKPVVSEDGDYRIYTFNNLPAMEALPYSRWGLRASPCLRLFDTPWKLREYSDKPPQIYWNKAAELCLKPIYEGLSTGWKYEPFAAQILKGLPDDPFKKAALIVQRVNERVRNTDWLTAAERAARSKSEDEETIHASDLSESVKRGWTNSTGVFYLVYRIFKDAGLHPKLQMVSNRDRWMLRYNLKDFYQFDDVLIGVDSADGKNTAWLDPGNRLLPLGIINPAYQGVLGLQIDTDTWTAKPEYLPSQDKSQNQDHSVYDLKVGEDAIQFHLSSTFKGFDDYVERDRYYALDPNESSKSLKEKWSENLPAYSVLKASAGNVSDTAHPVSLDIEARKDLDGGRRVTISPFPGMDRPWWVPTTWPEHRTDQIVMAYRCTRTADSTIHLPKGFTVGNIPPIQYASKVGTVSWTCSNGQDQEGEVLHVHYEVQADAMFLPPSEVETLKSFLAAMEEGWDRTIILERSR